MGEIDTLVSHYGLIALFLACFFEGETAAIAGGVLAHRHLLVLWQTIAVIAAGGFCSDMVIFLVGRRFRAHPRVTALTGRPAVTRILAAVARSPRRVAATFRFIPGARIVTPLALAHSAIPAPVYLGLTAMTALAWACTFALLGHGIGTALHLLFGPPHTHHILIAAALGILAAGALAAWHLRRR
ncbi:DedA family protein [Seohaeicola zhoushanensis]|uniref:DedA family protein n=1 Tax=Seohaeicola zhoushanensis TaxID=1569283 RepID=A0A8J3H3F8_9RHOB|nr:VTT domain-containing protein [Seohaeicola zhoushanensis]GHF73670.1 DedA family protein [Seohaeicola zhoushanensis]